MMNPTDQIQYLAVIGFTQTIGNPSALVRRTLTEDSDNIEICTPISAWVPDPDMYGLFIGLDDRGIAIPPEKAMELVNKWQKGWPV